MLRDEAVDGILQGDYGGEHAALGWRFGELREQDLDRVQPGARGGGEVEDQRGCRVSQCRALARLWAP